jgi:hypothetical protein
MGGKAHSRASSSKSRFPLVVVVFVFMPMISLLFESFARSLFPLSMAAAT